MYQKYELSLPAEAPLVFSCTSISTLNLYFKNTGLNPFTSVRISLGFSQSSPYFLWFSQLSHFDYTQSPQDRLTGLVGENVYNLTPGAKGVVLLDTKNLYSLLVEINGDSSVFLEGYGE